jgi:hypothetical protein
MRKLMLLCASLCAMAFVVAAEPAYAQNLAWVSPNGNDANSCSETAPCATFAGAISKGGVAQINCEGSGNYGALNSTTVSITGSIIIDCGAGNVGEMTTNGGTYAININTGSAATIVLRHLSLNGGNISGATGINTQSFASGTLIVEDCMIHGFGNIGIKFVPASGRGTLQVSNSLLYDNGFAAIFVAPNAGQIASVALDSDELIANGDGLYLSGATVAGTIRHSVVAENGADGVIALANQVYFTVEESSIIDNLDIGVATNSAGANVTVGASTIGGNGTGVKSFSGSLISFGNNQMSANGTNGAFTSTTPLQ